MFIQTVFVALLMLVLGLLTCFAGFRLFVILLPVYAFFAGFLATAQAIQQLFGGGFLATVSSWVFAFVIGILFAVLAYLFFYAAIVLLAVTAGYELGVGLLSGLGVSSGVLLFLVGVVVAAAFTVAVVLLNLPKLLIVVLSAGIGAGLIVTGFLVAFGRVSLEALHWGVIGAAIRVSWFWFLVFLALSAVGIAVQLFAPEGYTLAPYEMEWTSVGSSSQTTSASPPTGAEPAV